MDNLRSLILNHEGLKLKPYTDTTGNLTIGIGRNLEGRGISEAESFFLLENDLKEIEEQLIKHYWFVALDKVRQEVIIELVFNVGLTRALGFKKMIEALKSLEYRKAADELLDSAWTKQVGERRSNSLYSRLLTGKY